MSHQLMLPEAQIVSLVKPLMVSEFDTDPIEQFAALSWSIICEPGDGFAGKLIDTFGSARALSLELLKTPASEYVGLFADAGSDWLEMQEFGKFESILADSRQRWGSRMNSSNVLGAIQKVSKLGGWFVSPLSQLWPSNLDDLERHKPRGLWGFGNSRSLETESIAFVGSRITSAYGEMVTSELAGSAVASGFSVVSGGAYGIDSMAHRVALAMQGTTLAIMAGGIDRLYPSGNAQLFEQIRQVGCVISEMPPGAEPTKWRFLQRNRLIAALGSATIVVEAGERSGAASTANRAHSLGRPVGAVPGPITSPGSQGCHKLIQDSVAQLVTSGDDVLELVGISRGSQANNATGLGALEVRVFDAIGFASMTSAEISHSAGLTASEIKIALTSLQLLGMIQGDSRGWRRV